jgi:hypothetical protein
MAHFREKEHPKACIYGKLISGDKNVSIPHNSGNGLIFVRLQGFFSEVKQLCESTDESLLKLEYAHQNFEWCGGLNSLNGRYGILENVEQSRGLERISRKKLAKEGTHNQGFSAEGRKVICYYDNVETKPKSLTLVKISKA